MLDCSKNTDIEVVDKIKSGDIDAYFCIVENYKEKLLRYILRITNIDLEEAENLLQEVFIKAYENINGYNYKYSFSSWVYRIAHNKTIDYYRKNKNKEVLSLETEDDDYKKLINMLDSGEDIEKKLKDKELIKQVTKILNNIEIKYRDVLILKYLEEKNYSEISDILRIPEGTVATLLNRGKEKFRQEATKTNLKNYL